MEKEKWKLRVCVMLVVLIALITGIIYYVQFMRTTEITEGVLIHIMDVAEEGLEVNGTD